MGIEDGRLDGWMRDGWIENILKINIRGTDKKDYITLFSLKLDNFKRSLIKK